MSSNEVRFAVIAPDGDIIKIAVCSPQSLRLQGGDGLEVRTDVPDGITDLSHYWNGSEYVEYPVSQPSPYHKWNGSEWIDLRTDEDLAAERDTLWTALRAERDRLLTASDWTQVPDAALTTPQRAAWQDYRQALRDMPETTEDPAAPVWPKKP